VEAALSQELERLKSEPVGDDELQKAKNRIEASFVYGQDSLFYQAMLIAEHETALDWRSIDAYIPSIRKVSAGDIMRVAKAYLNKDNSTVGILIPLPPRAGKIIPDDGSVRERIIR